MSSMMRSIGINAIRACAIGLVSIMLFVSVGLVVGSGTMGTEHGSMADCPFMVGDGALCPMGIVEHLGTWQALASSMPERFGIIAALSMVVAVFALLAAQEMDGWKRRSIRLGPRQALYQRNFPNSTLFFFVRTLF